MDGSASGTTRDDEWAAEINVMPGKARHTGLSSFGGNSHKPKRLYQDVQTGHIGKVSWGEPAMVAEASCDKRCPVCTMDKRDGFQIEFEGSSCSAIWCPGCGFSFGRDISEADGRQTLMFGPQAGGKEVAALQRDRARKRTKCNE